MRFRAAQHIRRQSDFQRIRANGRRHHCGAFLVWYAPQPDAEKTLPTRVAFIASKAAIGNSTTRNRARRRLRETFRRHQNLLPKTGHDLLFIAKPALNQLAHPQLQQSFISALQKIFPTTTDTNTGASTNE